MTETEEGWCLRQTPTEKRKDIEKPEIAEKQAKTDNNSKRYIDKDTKQKLKKILKDYITKKTGKKDIHIHGLHEIELELMEKAYELGLSDGNSNHRKL